MWELVSTYECLYVSSIACCIVTIGCPGNFEIWASYLKNCLRRVWIFPDILIFFVKHSDNACHSTLVWALPVRSSTFILCSKGNRAFHNFVTRKNLERRLVWFWGSVRCGVLFCKQRFRCRADGLYKSSSPQRWVFYVMAGLFGLEKLMIINWQG